MPHHRNLGSGLTPDIRRNAEATFALERFVANRPDSVRLQRFCGIIRTMFQGGIAMRPSLHPVRMTYYEAPDLAEEVRALAAELRVTVAQAQRLINRKGIAALREAA